MYLIIGKNVLFSDQQGYSSDDISRSENTDNEVKKTKTLAKVIIGTDYDVLVKYYLKIFSDFTFDDTGIMHYFLTDLG